MLLPIVFLIIFLFIGYITFIHLGFLLSFLSERIISSTAKIGLVFAVSVLLSYAILKFSWLPDLSGYALLIPASAGFCNWWVLIFKNYMNRPLNALLKIKLVSLLIIHIGIFYLAGYYLYEFLRLSIEIAFFPFD